MLNVKTLTDTLSRMQLPELYNYATVNKNDPYIVSLALSIANQKKQADIAKRGQAGMTPQPKVVDQALAQMMAPPPQQMAAAPQQQMLPEDTGIGQLPAQNMQNMAEGGIVAFENGGSVPGYAAGVFTGNPEEYIYTGGIGQPFYIDVPSYNPRKPVDPAVAALKGRKFATKEEAIAAINALSNPAAARPSGPFDYPVGAKVDLPKPVNIPPPPPLPAAAPKPVAAAKPAAPAAPVPAPAPVDPMAGIKALDTTPITAAEAKKQAAELSDSTELRKQLEANEKFTTDAYDKLLGNYEKKIAEMPEAYKGYEARLQKEEAEAATDKDKALGMAIFQAGLGMMSGTSQYAFENIGKGALAGLENYQSALKDLKKAQRERDKAFADIEAARLAEKRGDIKTHTELQARGIEALSTAKNRTVEATSKIFDVDTRTATGIFEKRLSESLMNQRTMYTSAVDIGKQRMSDEAARQRDLVNNAAALERTKIQASAPTGIERILSNPKLLAAYKDYATAGTETKGINAFALEAIKDPSLLPRLEAGSAQDRQLAASIKQHMQSMMISPVNLPGGAANLRP